MKIRYSARARDDLRHIFGYLDKRAPKAARTVRNAVRTSIAVLAVFPLMAPSTEEPDVRELTIVRYPYKVYFKVVEDEIQVLYIRDARRRPWMGEEEEL